MRFFGPKKLDIEAPSTAPPRLRPASSMALTRPGDRSWTASFSKAIVIANPQAKQRAVFLDEKVQREALTSKNAKTK